jgi:peptidylprolyl isomerase
MAKKKKKESWKEKRRRAAIKRQKALEAERLRREREPKKGKGSSRRKALAVLFVFLICLPIGVYAVWQMNGTIDEGSSSSNIVLLKTTMGDIKIELYDDMPVTTGNFKKLVEQGVYDGTIFHRVIDEFVIQGGDASEKQITVPTIPDELPNKHSNDREWVAMAKTSKADSATSQFYINLKNNSNNLDSNYSVFGKVIDGMDVVDAIGEVPTDANDKPLQDVKIVKAELVK